jgi:hypothetical protein
MLRRIGAATGEVVGLFVTDWLSAALALCILAGGWALARVAPGPGAGFAMAGALAVLVAGEAVVRGRAAGRRES